MSCTSPLYAIDYGVKPNGKRSIKVLGQYRSSGATLAQLEEMLGVGRVIPLPCGKCLACRKSKAREWAVRCVLEATEYEDNCFITLTYDDAHYPKYQSQLKKDLQNFFKRIRKVYDLRYFACCEAGSQNKRYHFHALLFGVDLDKKTLEQYWRFGFVDTGSLTPGACFYVSQYAEKKVFVKDEFSFIRMSTHPGLGFNWFMKHVDLVDYGQVFGSFGTNNLPRYFEKISVRDLGVDFTEIKNEKLNKSKAKTIHDMIQHGFKRVEDLFQYNAEVDLNNFKHKKRRADL